MDDLCLDDADASKIKVVVRVRSLTVREKNLGVTENVTVNTKLNQCTITNPTNGEKKVFL